MERQEIRNRIIEQFKTWVAWTKANPRQSQFFQLGQIYELFSASAFAPSERNDVLSVAREIVQELEHAGFIYEGQAAAMSTDAVYPLFTITEYGKEAFLQEDWLPYDPEGYIKTLTAKIPQMDSITLAYVGEAVAAFNRRNLLSATIMLGVASESLMLTLIEAYAAWIKDSARQAKFRKATEGRFISVQYKAFKAEFNNDKKLFSKDIEVNWETYLDGIFNFIRLNRNDAGHPTGKQMDAKITYSNLQIFAEYAQFIFTLTHAF